LRAQVGTAVDDCSAQIPAARRRRAEKRQIDPKPPFDTSPSMGEKRDKGGFWLKALRQSDHRISRNSCLLLLTFGLSPLAWANYNVRIMIISCDEGHSNNQRFLSTVNLIELYESMSDGSITLYSSPPNAILPRERETGYGEFQVRGT
jgi:hypothetical protein